MKGLIKKHSAGATLIIPLVVFRMVFGLVVLAEIIPFWLNGWIETHSMLSKLFFYHNSFKWMITLQVQGMFLVFILLGAVTFFVRTRFLYRFSALVLFLSLTRVELLNKTNYVNHYHFK